VGPDVKEQLPVKPRGKEHVPMEAEDFGSVSTPPVTNPFADELHGPSTDLKAKSMHVAQLENGVHKNGEVKPLRSALLLDNDDDDDDDDDEYDNEYIDRKSELKFEYRIDNFVAKMKKWKEDGNTEAWKSPDHEAPDGFKWGLLVFPYGLPNNEDASGKAISVYIEIRDTERNEEKYGPGWSRKMRIRLSVVNVKKNGTDIQHESTDTYDAKHTDWGFLKLIKLDMVTVEEGFLDDNGALTLAATLIPEINFTNYNSKQQTGKVGLENHGATCYLNSLLQTLFMTKKLRLAVYDMDTEQDKANAGIGLELQRLFWNLQTQKEAVSTRQLTTAFGWGNQGLFRQHDVQEMNRELCEKLERRMKNTEQSGLIKSLYTGKTRSYIKCLNVDFQSTRDEEFYDIQLDVKNMKNVYESFQAYIREEKLEGENQYEAEGFGKQDANKGVGFLSFPPVLNLHLKRFEYDVQTDATVKVNDSFKFPVRLHLGKFLHSDVERKDESEYDYILHSVLVHVGDVNSGHYYAFINDLKKSSETNKFKSDWFRFDDERVTIATKRHAVNNNFGGVYSNGFARTYSATGNAYMLVYIQMSKLEEVLPSVPDSRVPKELLARFARDAELLRQKNIDDERRRNSMSFWCVTQQTLDRFYTYTRYEHKHRKHMDFVNPADSELVTLLKTHEVVSLYKMVAVQLGKELGTFRLWNCCDRENSTNRPDGVILHLDSLVDSVSSAPNIAPLLFLEENLLESVPVFDTTEPDPKKGKMESGSRMSSEGKRLEWHITRYFKPANDHVLLFFREFQPDELTENRKLSHLGYVMMPSSSTHHDLANAIAELFSKYRRHETAPRDPDSYFFWELLTPKDVNPLKPPELGPVLKSNELQHGDIVIFQFKEAEARKASSKFLPEPIMDRTVETIVNYRPASEFSCPKDYLRNMDSRVRLSLISYHAKDMSERIQAEMPSFFHRLGPVEDAVMGIINAKIDPQHNHLRISDVSHTFHYLEQARSMLNHWDEPRDAEPSQQDTLWKRIVRSIWEPPSTDTVAGAAERVLVYEIVPCPANDTPGLFEFEVQNGRYPETRRGMVYVQYKEKFKALEDSFLRLKFVSTIASNIAHVRWLAMTNERVECVVTPGDGRSPREALSNFEKVRETALIRTHRQRVVADVVWKTEGSAETNMEDFERGSLVVFRHFDSSTPSNCNRATVHGLPFTCSITKMATVETLRRKIALRLCIPYEEVVEWRFATFGTTGKYESYAWIEDEDKELWHTNADLFVESETYQDYPVIGIYHPNPKAEVEKETAARIGKTGGGIYSRHDGGRSPVISNSAIET